MKFLIFLLVPLFLSCDHHPKRGAITKDTTTTISDTTEETELSNEEYLSLRKSEIDSLFLKNKDSLTYNDEDNRGTLRIGHLFSHEQQEALFRYYENDSTEHVVIIRQSGTKWDTIFSAVISPAQYGNFSDFIVISDFNGDHIPDLKVLKFFWDIHVGERSDLWLYRNKRFVKVKNFDHIVSAEYWDKTGLIYSYQSDGCADMAMRFGVYKIVADTVQQIDFRYCDCCDPADSCEITKGKDSFKVPYKSAYKYVPAYFQDGVKEKLEM